MTQMFSVPGQRGTLQSRVEAGHSLRILLVDDTYAYSDTHVEVSDVTAWEISGGGYARFVLTGVSWDTTGAVPALLGDDAAVAGSSGSASTAYVFDNTDEELLLRVVFDSPVALSGELPIEWPGGRLATYDDATDDIDALDARVDALEVGAVLEVQAGDNVTVDSTDPQRPIVSATGGGGGGLPSGGSVGQTIANTGSGTGAWTDLADVPIDGTPLGEGLDYLADELAKVADPTWLRPVDVVATSNVDVSSPGTIDGEVSYRYALLTAQTDPAENLVWDSSGLGVPMVPSPIHPSGAQIQTATTVVNLGTHAGETWRITSGSAGTDSAIWGQVTGGSGPDLSNADPLGPGTTDPGTSPDASRDDHVHPRQTGIVNSEIDAAAAIAQSKISGLTTDLAGKVPTTRTVNGHALSSNVTVTASDVGAVPTSRTLAGLDLTADRSASALRTALSLVVGTDVQAYDADLAAIAALTTDPFGRALLELANAGAARTALGLAIGTDVQAYDPELAALAGLTSAADRVPYFTGAGTASLATLTSFIRTLLDDTDAATARATLGAAAVINGGGETVATNAAATGAVTVDPANGNAHNLTLTGNVTLTLTAPTSGKTCCIRLRLIQDGTGSRAVTWPSSVKWPGGVAPTLSTAAGAIDKIVLETDDGGTRWEGGLVGKAYA